MHPGTVKGITTQQLQDMDCHVILGNTYHLQNRCVCIRWNPLTQLPPATHTQLPPATLTQLPPATTSRTCGQLSSLSCMPPDAEPQSCVGHESVCCAHSDSCAVTADEPGAHAHKINAGKRVGALCKRMAHVSPQQHSLIFRWCLQSKAFLLTWTFRPGSVLVCAMCSG